MPAINRLIWKLLLINLVVICFVLVIVWISIDTLAAGYFVTLMERYHISPEPAHAMFVNAVHRYLLWACLAAALLAAILSFLMMRRALSPLTRMTDITRQIADGNFKGRVPEIGADEVGQLSAAFNKMAESLEKIEKLRRNLMIDVAHELRTPLTNMRGYLEALKDEVLPPTSENFSMLHDETLRLAELVEDVLQLARADAAKHRLEYRHLDLPFLLREAKNIFSPRFEEKGIAVTFSIPDVVPQVFADRNRIYRTIRNLMDNAARYTPANGHFEIRVEPGADRLRVVFSNTVHRNINEADLPFIFERFFRGEKSRSRKHGGAGIGLSIVKELVEAHGGEVGAVLNGKRIFIWFELPT